MAPFTSVPLSPAELSYLHSSLVQSPPIRPDGRSPSQFRPLVAETDILPSANGSARICFSDGTEAIVGVKADVEKSGVAVAATSKVLDGAQSGGLGDAMDEDKQETDGTGAKKGRDAWLEVAIEIPGLRDDDSLPVFLSAMLTEALLADGELKQRVYINRRFHWRLYVDVLLLSQPLSYPLPLLSLTTHLALLSTRMPALISEQDEDPLFNDDWEASTYLYPRSNSGAQVRPPVTLLVMSVGDNILFDPTKEELAVADALFAISTAQSASGESKMIAMRTIDPPSRLTPAGTPNVLNTTATGGIVSMSAAEALALRERDQGQTVWRPPRGGARRGVLAQMVKMVLAKGEISEEVMQGLAGVET